MEKECCSPFDFMCLFTSIYISLNKFSFNKNNLINFINECKINKEFPKLLNNILITFNQNKFYSLDIEEAIQNLKLAFVIYDIKEDEENIYIYTDTPSLLLSKGREKYYMEMTNFITMLNIYEENKEHLNKRILK